MTAAKKTPSQRGKRNRLKGSELERDVCREFSELLGVKVQRKLGQARDSGCDAHVGPLVIEIKRRTSLGSMGKWLDQAEAGTDRSTGMVPCVVAREDRRPAIITMQLTDFLNVVTKAMVRGVQLWD
jgi:hypothetical protein